MPSFFLVISLFLLAACSNSKNATPVGFKLTLSSITTGLGANGEGGFVIYGKSTTGAAFGKVITSATPPAMTIPNGTWTFYGLAWDGTPGATDEDKAMRGTVRCANSGTIVLDGSATSVNLTLTNDNCDTASFTDTAAIPMHSSAPKKFAFIQTVFCKSLDAATVDTTNPSANCEYDLSTFTARKTSKGFGTGVKFSLQSFALSAGGAIQWLGEKITSNCVAMPDASTGILPTDAQAFNLPSKSVFPLGLKAEIFYGPSSAAPCDEAYGKGEIVIPNGSLSDASVAGVERVKSVIFDPTTVKTFLRVGENMACANAKPVGAFAGGYGSANVPSYICNNDQLNLMRGSNYLAGTPTAATRHVVLLKNINHWYGLDPAGGGPPDQEPIGEVVSGSPNASTAFTGSFNGNNKKIIGWAYRISEPESKQIGFFRNVGSGGKVFDLELIGSEIQKNYNDRADNVGALVGISDGLFDNITIRHADIRASVNVGGLAGTINGTGRISNSKVYKSEIQATRYAGGIVGELAAGGGGDYIARSGVYDTLIEGDSFKNNSCADLTINQASCTGGNLEWRSGYCIDPVAYPSEPSCPIATHAWLQPYGFGGLVGKVNFTSGGNAIQSSRADGLIIGHSTVGGLVGYMNNNGPINDSYSNVNIEARTPSTVTSYKKRAGGIIGAVGGASPVPMNRVYFDIGGMLHDSTVDSNPIQGFGIAGGTTNIFASVTPTTATTGVNLNLAGIAQNGTAMWAAGIYSAWGAEWVHPDPGYAAPRLVWENSADHPCEGKRASLTGAGTAANPYLVCTQAQFLTLNGSSSYYKLGDTIDLRSVSAVANAVATFPGILDGNNKALSNYSNTSFSGAGIFATINGTSTVKNLFVTGTNISTTNIMAGALAKFNNGIIDNVEVHGTVKAREFVGGIVAQNNKAILRSASFATVGNNTASVSWSHVGGIAGNNQGIIGLSESYADIILTSAPTADGTKVGGIAGNNEQLGSPSVEVNPGETVTGGGIIFESQFSGHFQTSGTNAINKLAGITGSNSAGTAKVLNCLAEFDIKDTTFDGSNSYLNNVAGLVAEGITGTSTQNSWSRLNGNFSNALNGANFFYFTVPNDASTRTGLRYLDSSSTQYPAEFNDDGDSVNTLRLITEAGTNGSPSPSDLYTPNLASYSGWDITDDEDNQTAVWKLHSGDTFGPRLNRDDEEGPDEAFNLYSGVTP